MELIRLPSTVESGQGKNLGMNHWIDSRKDSRKHIDKHQIWFAHKISLLTLKKLRKN